MGVRREGKGWPGQWMGGLGPILAAGAQAPKPLQLVMEKLVSLP